MPQNSRKNKSDTPVITSPDGVKIQITAGRKLQLIREYARDPLITDAQFRLLVVTTDRTNEGYGDEEAKWGRSYANYETLSDDTAKTPSAVKRIVCELETGEREVGTGKKKGIKPCRVALSVERDSRPGRSKVNRYWQSDFNTIEDILADECDRQGIKPTPEIFRQMLTEAIGRLDSHRMISLPQGTISVRDFVKCFASDGSQNDLQKPSGNLTTDMMREIAETRSRSLPSDWTTVRDRVTGKTAEMMDAIAADRKGAA